MEKGIWGSKYIQNNSNEVIGIDMGFYGCNEHERGISELTKQFGINLEGKITKVPKNVFVGNIPIPFTTRVSDEELISFNHLVYDFKMGKQDDIIEGKIVRRETTLEEKQKYLKNKLFLHTSANIYPKTSSNYLLTMWDDSSFLVLDKGHDTFYKRLEDAFLNDDVMIAQHPRFSENSRLVIGIYSELSKLG